MLTVLALLLLTACSPEQKTVSAKRSVSVEERGPVAKVYPSGEEARVDRHGRWTGHDADGVMRWEVRYVRGNPAGAYREWDAESRLIAEWAYSWEGALDGEALWYNADGDVRQRCTIFPEEQPEFDALGDAAALAEWCAALDERRAAKRAASDESVEKED